MRKKIVFSCLIIIGIMMALCACGTQSQSYIGTGVDFQTLQKTKDWNLEYATLYSVEEYDPYTLITIQDDGRYLIVPEQEKIPSNLPDDIVVLKQPIENVYLVSTSVMDMLREIGALDHIRLTGTKAQDWYIDEAVDLINQEKIVYAGKYSQPDYELILNENCNLAIENTMIYHNPEVKEKLISIGIPVFVERSSYEPDPLGRLEWIKLYGLLFGKEEAAQTYFDTQVKNVLPIMEKEQTGKTMAFFYITSNGAVNVRKPNDYISKMIKLAGGEYVLHDILEEEDNALSTMNMQMEDFYAAAKDADVLIYNSTTVGELENIDDLLEKSPLFKDFLAVKEGNVYCTSSNFFQKSTGICELIEDMNKVLTDSPDTTYRFLKKLD